MKTTKALLSLLSISLLVAIYVVWAPSDLDESYGKHQTSDQNRTETRSTSEGLISSIQYAPQSAQDPNPEIFDQLNGTSESSIFEELFPEGDRAWAWAKVDLEAIEKELPDNLYWSYASPTEDATVLAFRKEQREHWDTLHRKILSNTATESEIRDYYDHRHTISNDYVEFTTVLLNRHGLDLPEQDYAMQTLARNMHLSRLEEIPGKLARALENRQRQIDRKQAWLENKESFEADLAQQREDALRDLGKI